MSNLLPTPAETGAKLSAGKLIEILSESVPSQVIEEARELLRRRRVLDFLIQPGKVGAKVHDEAGRSMRIEVAVTELSEAAWQTAFDRLAERALYMAMLLCGRLPPEMEGLFADLGPLYPRHAEELIVTLNGMPSALDQAPVTAVVLELFERLEEDPFAVFLLRGRGRDETLLELQQRRQRVRVESVASDPRKTSEAQSNASETLSAAVSAFWSSGKKLESLSYVIRADELPASILKWLDPLPLSGLEADVDIRFEEAYERIARLAQSYWLGL